MKSFWRLVFTGMLVVSIFPVASQAGTSEVFRLETTLQGVIQRGSFSNGFISKVVINADDFINLAQHRTLGTPVPNTEILALTSECNSNDFRLSDVRLIVFDTAGQSNRVTIGTFTNLTAAAYTRRHYVETIDQLTVNDISDGTNGITGGSFYYHGKISINTNRCATSFGGQWTGLLGTTFPLILTNFPCTNFIVPVTLTNCVTVSNMTFAALVEAKKRHMCTNVYTDILVTNCAPDGTTNIVDTVQTYDVIIPRSPIRTGQSIGTVDLP